MSFARPGPLRPVGRHVSCGGGWRPPKGWPRALPMRWARSGRGSISTRASTWRPGRTLRSCWRRPPPGASTCSRRTSGCCATPRWSGSCPIRPRSKSTVGASGVCARQWWSTCSEPRSAAGPGSGRSRSWTRCEPPMSSSSPGRARRRTRWCGWSTSGRCSRCCPGRAGSTPSRSSPATCTCSTRAGSRWPPRGPAAALLGDLLLVAGC